jgi:hypothetical protein
MPRFTSFSTIIKQLAFTCDGSTLFHWTPQRTFVWEIDQRRRRGSAAGELFGTADDGKTFITRVIDQAWVQRDIHARSGYRRQAFVTDPVPPPRFTLWDVVTGVSLPFTPAAADGFPLHQRLHVMADRYHQQVQLVDVFGIIPLRTMDLQAATHGDALFENWVITPDDRHLAVIYYLSAGGFYWNGGVSVRLSDGEKVFSFEGGREDFPPHLYFSREHQWMLSPYSGNVNLYDLITGKHVVKFQSAASVISAHKTQKLLAEISSTRLSLRVRHLDRPDQILWEVAFTSQLCDVEFHPDGERIAVVLDTGSIELRAVKTGSLLVALIP